jgi:hypothetical protein
MIFNSVSSAVAFDSSTHLCTCLQMRLLTQSSDPLSRHVAIHLAPLPFPAPVSCTKTTPDSLQTLASRLICSPPPSSLSPSPSSPVIVAGTAGHRCCRPPSAASARCRPPPPAPSMRPTQVELTPLYLLFTPFLRTHFQPDTPPSLTSAQFRA